jgi:hypothetical protein
VNTLYLLTESEADSLFYEACVERISGKTFTPTEHHKVRKGSGISAVRAALQLSLQQIQPVSKTSGLHLLIAMDNDRSPHALATEALTGNQRTKLAKADAHQADRYDDLLSTLKNHLGSEPVDWEIPVAIAIPVEMLESWLILIARGGNSNDLPRFTTSDSWRARRFYQPHHPPPQLKELSRQVQKEDGIQDKQEWMLVLVTQKLNPAKLAQTSSSFALFKNWLDRWA